MWEKQALSELLMLASTLLSTYGIQPESLVLPLVSVWHPA